MEISAKKKRKILADAKTRKARVHIGLNGVTESILQNFKMAFNAPIAKTRPNMDMSPLEAIRVKVHSTFDGDLQAVVKKLESVNDSTFIAQDGEFLIFYKPIDT